MLMQLLCFQNIYLLYIHTRASRKLIYFLGNPEIIKTFRDPVREVLVHTYIVHKFQYLIILILLKMVFYY